MSTRSGPRPPLPAKFLPFIQSFPEHVSDESQARLKHSDFRFPTSRHGTRTPSGIKAMKAERVSEAEGQGPNQASSWAGTSQRRGDGWEWLVCTGQRGTGYLKRAVRQPERPGSKSGRPNGQEHLRNHVKTPGLHEGNEKSTQGIKGRTEKIRLLGGGRKSF